MLVKKSQSRHDPAPGRVAGGINVKKLAFVFAFFLVVVMSLPVFAAETRGIFDESDEIAALADDIVSAVNSAVDTENSEHRYTKKTLPHVTYEDIAGLTMYRLYILPDTVFAAGMAPDELENVLESADYEWILQVDIEDVNVTVHLSRYSGADPEHLAKLVDENVITDEQAEDFTKKQGQWRVYSLALSDTYNPAFDAIDAMKNVSMSEDISPLYVLSLQNYAMAATAYTTGNDIMIKPLSGYGITASSDGAYKTAALTPDDTSEYMTIGQFAEKYGTTGLISGERGSLIGALPGDTVSVSRYIPAMLIIADAAALGAVLLINRRISARRADNR